MIALLIKEKGKDVLQFLNQFKSPILIISTLMFFAGSVRNIHPFVITITVLVLSITLVIGSIFEFDEVLGKILNNTFLQYIGKTSYGIYLYHKPIPYLLKIVLDKFDWRLNKYALLVGSILITFAIAHLSYQILEKRFLKTKARFDI